jgi:predicted transposase/invertase (TIGR01784 family)
MKKRKKQMSAMLDEEGMPELLPPSDDRVFKLLLTHGDAGPVLKDIISAIIGRKVRKVLVRNNEIPAGDILEKQERLDVNCVTDDGEQIDLEMQASRIEETGDDRHVNLKRKSLFYLCDLHSSQSMKGKSYTELARTWQVTFCAYTIFPGDKKFFRAATMRDEDGNVLTNDITMAFVELTKAANLAKRPVSELSPLEMWTIFFGYADRTEYREVIEAIFKKKKEVGMAGTLLKSISKDERERAVFRSRRMFQTDIESNLITAKKRGIEIGEKRGIEIGEKRGIEIGEKRGIGIGEKRGIGIGEKRGIGIGEKRGIEIGEKLREADRNETARILKLKGLPIDVIVEATKLTPDEIERLDDPQVKSHGATRKPSKR